MSRTTVRVPAVPEVPPHSAVRGPGPRWGLEIGIGADIIHCEIPWELEPLYWLAAVLREAAEHTTSAANELSCALDGVPDPASGTDGSD